MSEEREAGGKQKFVIHLSFSTLLTAFFIVLATVTAAYVFGVMSGRSSSMPAHAPLQPEPELSTPSARDAEPILRAQDLDYAQVLRGEEVKRPVEPKPEPPKPESPKSEDAESVLKTETPPQIAQQQANEPAPQNNNAQFDYVFQLSSLRDAEAADNLREKLEGQGLRTRLERNGKLYVILVMLRGPEERAKEIGEIAKKLKLGEPLLRSRKPVNS